MTPQAGIIYAKLNDDMLKTLSDVVTFPVADADITMAKAMRRQRDKMYGNIYQEKETDLRWVGEVGEIIVHRALMMVDMNTTEWHTQEAAGRSDFNFRGQSIDVKTVKRKVPMQLHYEAQITKRHASTPCDALLFACYEYPRQLLHVLGTMDMLQFLNTAKCYQAGDNVHAHYKIRPGHEILAVRVDQLTPFRSFLRSSQKANKCDKAA